MAPADTDGISRLFPKEVFTGETGDFLRSMGFSPDAVGNVAWTAETFATLDARYRERLEAFVDKADRVLGDSLSVRPLLLVPETVWQGEYRNFLCATCRFYPADPSNVFFLAGTLQTAKTLGLPLQANISPEQAHDFAVQIIGVLGEMYEKANKQEAASLAYEGARGLGTVMTVKLFDPPQYEPEHKLFGPLLDRDFSKLLGPNP
ncbi:MAG: hypothetical protein GY844_16135 [Bradyrhizobium sp.]|nr:hypothetical protein [Bradyrhizobium sp.]